MLPNIIHISQSAIIKGWDMFDNIALAHDLCVNLSHNDFMAKFDIKKAFDVLNRESLLHRLMAKGFPPKFICWVKACISNVSFFIIIYNEILTTFTHLMG